MSNLTQIMDYNGLALGTWLFGGQGWQANLLQSEITHLVELAVDQGIKVIDTAPIYGLGKAEEFLAAPLKTVRSHVRLVTKCGMIWDQRGRIHKDHSSEGILKEVEHSLKRLQVSEIDVLLIHWPDDHTSLEETCEGLRQVQKKGYVKHVGFSNWEMTEIQKATQLAPVFVLQDPCNLAQPLSPAYLTLAKQFHFWIMGYSALAQGLLTGKYLALPKLPKRDFRNFNPLFFEPQFSKVHKFVAELTTLLPEAAESLTDLALRYAQSLCHSAVVGVRNEKQLKEVLQSHQKTLPNPILEKIHNFQLRSGFKNS